MGKQIACLGARVIWSNQPTKQNVNSKKKYHMKQEKSCFLNFFFLHIKQETCEQMTNSYTLTQLQF